MDQEALSPAVEETVETGAPTKETAPTEAAENAEAEKPEAPPEEKPQKTPEERERARLLKAIDRKTRQAAEWRARAEHLYSLTPQQQQAHNRPDAGDSETLSLTRAEAERLIAEEVQRRAPTIAKQQAQEEQARSAAQALKKSLGDDFEELTSDLADVFNGPRQLDVLQAENPAALIRYLTDPDNADEAEAISGMSHFQAGRAIAQLEAKLKAITAKPQPSKVPAPLEPLKGRGPNQAMPSDSDSIEEWTKKERARLAKLRNQS